MSMLCLTEDFKNANLSQGEQFMITLSHNQAAGYVWKFTFDASKTMKLSETFVPDDAKEMAQVQEAEQEKIITPPLFKRGSRKREVVAPHPICHGQLQVIFQAVAPGEIEIRASHERPDSTLADRFKTFRLTVV